MLLRALPLLAFFFAAPFWEAKDPRQWTDLELAQVLNNSPWAQPAPTPGSVPSPPMLVQLASAEPIRIAEQEAQRRARLKLQRAKGKAPEYTESDVLAEEYHAWLEENRGTQFILALRIDNLNDFGDEREIRKMEEGCVLRMGRNKIKMTGHFPPTPEDPFLRLAFPRQKEWPGKSIQFELYVPGVAMPMRTVEFPLRELQFRGKLEL